MRQTFDARLIIRNGDANCTPRSCDRTPSDCFLRGVIKKSVMPKDQRQFEATNRNAITEIRKIGRKLLQNCQNFLNFKPFLYDTYEHYIHNSPLQLFGQDYGLASHRTHVVCHTAHV